MGQGRNGWESDELDDAYRDDAGTGRADDDEDEIALRALSAWLDIDGDDDVSIAQREALAAIAEAAMATKARREDHERRRRVERQQRAATITEAERRDAVRHALAANRRRGVPTYTARLDEVREAGRTRDFSSHEASRQDAARQEVTRTQGAGQHAMRPEGAPRGTRRTEPMRVDAPRTRDPRPGSAGLRRSESPPKALPSPSRPTGGSPPPRSVRLAEESEHEDIDLDAIAAAFRRTMDTATRELLAEEAEASQEDQAMSRSTPTIATARSGRLDQDLPTLTGADLASWRAQLRLTQTSAADRLGVGQGTVSKAESRPAAELGPALQEALAHALGRTR